MEEHFIFVNETIASKLSIKLLIDEIIRANGGLDHFEIKINLCVCPSQMSKRYFCRNGKIILATYCDARSEYSVY